MDTTSAILLRNRQPTRPALLQENPSTYAEAVGLRLGPLKWLAEPGLRPGDQSPVLVAARSQFLHADAAALEEPMDITPDETTIQEIVEACFELVDRRDAPG